MKNFSPKAASAYARLLAKYVDYDEIDNFQADFEAFMDAYENGNKVIHRDAPPDEIEDVVRSVFNKNPNVLKFSGEIKTDKNGDRYIVILKDETISGDNCDAHN